MQKPPHIITFGCRLNTYESEVIRKNLAIQHESLGTQSTHSDTIVFNTCGVTAEAERQARQAIRKARREHPDARIIATGCAVQMNPDTFAAMPEVDLILGNEEKLRAASYQSVQDETERVVVNDIMSVTTTALHLITGFENHVRAFIQVQNGCNHRCTFCRIPFGRGNSRSVALGEIVALSQRLVEQGYQEIVLTGVDITDYGKDLPGAPTLGQMVQRLLNLVPNLKRLRLSSLDPVEIDQELFDLICHNPRVMPHVHLSLQAGDDMILKRMKRRHLRADVIDVCARIRAQRPDVVFGADIIAGFPTETDAMFENSLEIVDECNITFLHVFPYSAHEGTPAARMPQVDASTIKARAHQLRTLGKRKLHEFLTTQLGCPVDILVEKETRGHTAHFAPVRLTNPSQNGTIIKGRVTGIEDGTLVVDGQDACKAS